MYLRYNQSFKQSSDNLLFAITDACDPFCQSYSTHSADLEHETEDAGGHARQKFRGLRLSNGAAEPSGVKL